MLRSPLIDHIQARRPWLDLHRQTRYGFTRRSAGMPRPDPDIAARLIRAFRRAEQDCPEDFRPDDVWSQFIQRHYGELHALIRRDDAEGLTDYLLSLPRQGAGHGYFQGQPAYEALRESPERQKERALWLLDHALGLAEALGLLRERCPEQGLWREPAITDTATLIAELEQALGMPVCLPPLFEGFFALEAETTPCHLRTLMASYAIHQLEQFFSGFHARPRQQLRVAEIGAGIGFTAYLAARRGLARYSIFDLAEINVAQGFFLLSTLGAGQVRLYGESHEAAVEVLPPWAYFSTLPQGYDAVLNVDSFPEIDTAMTRRYLRAMPGGAAYFFSLNQEAPRADAMGAERLPVRAMVANETGFQGLLRARNWLRAGYVDEVFRVA